MSTWPAKAQKTGAATAQRRAISRI